MSRLGQITPSTSGPTGVGLPERNAQSWADLMSADSTHIILLVEDDENDVTFMRLAMERAHLAKGLRVAEDGAQAIAYLNGESEFRGSHPPSAAGADPARPKTAAREGNGCAQVDS